MLTMLRCSLSAAAFKASLKDGDTRRLSVSDLVSSNRKGAPQVSVQMRHYSGASEIFLSVLLQIELSRRQRPLRARKVVLGSLRFVRI